MKRIATAVLAALLFLPSVNAAAQADPVSLTGGSPPTVGSPVTATLNVEYFFATWVWYRSADQQTWTRIGSSESYTPNAEDKRHWLKVTVRYFAVGGGADVEAVTDSVVVGSNSAPTFPTSERGVRSVDELTAAGEPIGDPFQAEDLDGDTLVYSLEDYEDAASFSINAASGQLLTSASLDHETDHSYSVRVVATDPSDAAATIDVDIEVGNVDEPGVVSLEPADPVVGTRIIARLTDPDGRGAYFTWEWYTSTDKSTWVSVASDTSSYTPGEADVGEWIRAHATNYSDGEGAGKYAETISDSVVAYPEPTNTAPRFALSETGDRSVDENTLANQDIGSAFQAEDDEDDTLSYALSGTDMGSFRIDGTSGQLSTEAALNYETKSSYSVTVTATDPSGLSGSVDAIITVGNVDEPGTVSLNSDEPMVGDTLTATLTDPDGGVANVTWQWQQSRFAVCCWVDISDADSDSYTVDRAWQGRYLRVQVFYSDDEDPGKSAESAHAQVPNNRSPYFPQSESFQRSIAENTPAGQGIGAPLAAQDPDPGDTEQLSLRENVGGGVVEYR